METQLFPLTSWQRGNLPGHQDCLISCQIFIAKLNVPFERSALAKAIKSMILRRDNFRIKLTQAGEQEILAHCNETVLKQLDFKATGENSLNEPLIEHLISDIGGVLSNECLYKFYVNDVTPNSFTLCLAYSPAVADPHSIHLIMDDIANLYRTELTNEKISLKNSPSFSNYLGSIYPNYGYPAEHRRDVYPESPEAVLPLYSTSSHRSTVRPITLARSIIDRKTSERISWLSTQIPCEIHEVIYSATVSYLSQLIDQAELTVFLSSLRGNSANDGNVAGPCSIILKIRNQIDSTASFAFNLSQLTRSLRDAYGNNDAPCCITSTSEFQSTNSHRDRAVVWINLLTVPESISDWDTSLVSIPSKEELRLISINFYFREDKRPIYVSCSSNNLENGCARSFIDGLVSFISNVVMSPELKLTTHELVSNSERDEILLRWNNTKSTYPKLCIHELFERQAESTPHRTAIEFEGKALTYAELNYRSNQLAHRIVSIRWPSNRKRPSDFLVGIYVDRSLEMVIGLLGAMKAGYAYVPIDPSYPEERIAFLIEDAGIGILLTRRHLIRKVENFGRKIICLEDEFTGPVDIKNISAEHVNLTPDDPVAVLYTSGSTGHPKGVFVSHRGMVSRLQWMNSVFPFTEDEVAGHIAQLPFVRALWELFIPLSKGIKVVIVDSDTTKDPEKLSRLIGEHKITRLVTAPSLAQTLVSSSHQVWRGLHALKHWFIGGESLHYKVVKAIREALPRVSICHLYGATEVHSFASYYPVVDEFDESTRVPIGRAISNTSILILDRHKRVLPVGIHGEICVLGDGVAGGYLNQPELTAEKFTDHDFTDVWSSTLYRTGDIGCYLPDQNLMFVSRVDHQVKIRGIRIELGEVETALLANKGVDKAVIVASEFGPNDFRLVAYIVPQLCNENFDIREWRRSYTFSLRRFLEQKLPTYMIPSYFVVLGELPLNAYGKVLRKKLPPPDVDSVGSIGYYPPRNECEKLLCEIWEHVLGLDKVGVLDNFFDLGGHSFLASRIKARVSDVFCIDLPLRDIFEKTNIAELAGAINSLVGRSSDRLPLTRASDSDPAPLTEEMRALEPELGKPSSLAYFCLRIFGEIDVRALRDSLVYLIQRHDALRMMFKNAGNDTYMLPSPTVHVDLSVIDMRGDLAGSEILGRWEKDMLRDKIRDLLSSPSDITSGCLTRWALIRVRPVESVFVGILDHIVVDGQSIAILKRELKFAYEAYCKGCQPSLPPLAFRFFDYAHWQERYRATATYAAGKQAYKEHVQKVLSSVKQIRVCPTPDAKTYYHNLHGIDRRTQIDVSDFCARAGITESMFYIVVFHLTAYEIFGQNDILISMVASDRKFLELEDVVGLFVHSTNFRSVLADGMPLIEFVTQTRMRVSDAQSVGYTHLEQKDIDCPGERPIADMRLNCRNFSEDGQWELFKLEVKPMDIIERLEHAGVDPVGENSNKILLRVDKERTNEKVDICGSGLIFSKESFEEFNDRFALNLRELTRVSDLSVVIEDLLRCKELPA